MPRRCWCQSHIIASKGEPPTANTTGRNLETLELTLREKENQSKSGPIAGAEWETERDLREQIRRLLALPMEKRTNFLRVRSPGGGSHL